MILPVLRSAALAAALSLASLAASAQTFGEFLKNPDLPVTFMGADYSAARYYGPPLTVSAEEMKTQFTKINELLVREAKKYDVADALRRKGEAVYAIHIAESVNQKIDPATIIVPSDVAPRTPFTAQTVEEMVSHYTYPAGGTGVGLVFVVESIDKNRDQEVFWATFVDLATRQMLYTEKIGGGGYGFGFRNHWAGPFNSGLSLMSTHYGKWKKKYVQK